jgi:hypothetical protein
MKLFAKAYNYTCMQVCKHMQTFCHFVNSSNFPLLKSLGTPKKGCSFHNKCNMTVQDKERVMEFVLKYQVYITLRLRLSATWNKKKTP